MEIFEPANTGENNSKDLMRFRHGFRPGMLSSGLIRWALVLAALSVILTMQAVCTRNRVVSRPPRINEQEKNEQVFRTNEDAVKAGIYEEFIDSMRLKGLPGRAETPEPARSSEVEIPEIPTDIPGPDAVMGFRVQLGAFNEQESAELFAERARERLGSHPVYIRYYQPLWKIQVGDCRYREEAERLREIMRGKGYPDAWITRTGIKR
jgi:SPOR domain